MKKLVLMLMICFGLAANTAAVELSGGELHGFLSQGYLDSSHNNFLAHNTEDGTFEYMEMGINYNKWLTPGLSAGFQLFAKDLGKSGNQEVKLDWAMLNYRWQPWLGAKAGRLKLNTGLYNDTRDIDMVRPWVLLPQSCYLEYFRDASLSVDGAGLYGTVPAGAVGSFSYEVQYGTQELNDERDGVMTRFVEDTTTFVQEETDDYDVDERWAVNLEWNTPVEGLVFGGTYTSADMEISSHYIANDSFSFSVPGSFDPDGPGPAPPVAITNVFTNKINAGDPLKTDFAEFNQRFYYVKYTWGNLELSGECMHQDQKQHATTISTGDTTLTVLDATGTTVIVPETVLTNGWTDTQTIRTDALGYYVSAAYRFCDWFQLGGYYSEAYPDGHDKDGDEKAAAGRNDFEAWLKDTCLTLRFDLGTSWIVKLEHHFMDGAAYHNPADNDSYNEHWNLTAAKVTYMF